MKPTAQEIRAAIWRDWHDRRGYLTPGFLELDNALGAARLAGGASWDAEEMRSWELARLDELMAAAVDQIAEGLERRLLDAVAAAAVRFAEEYPDAPRAKVPVA